jgi:hypothetical protein
MSTCWYICKSIVRLLHLTALVSGAFRSARNIEKQRSDVTTLNSSKRFGMSVAGGSAKYVSYHFPSFPCSSDLSHSASKSVSARLYYSTMTRTLQCTTCTIYGDGSVGKCLSFYIHFIVHANINHYRYIYIHVLYELICTTLDHACTWDITSLNR